MATTTTETTHGLTYPVARVIEVTAICRCRLLLLSVSLTIPVTGLRSLLATAMGVTVMGKLFTIPFTNYNSLRWNGMKLWNLTQPEDPYRRAGVVW